MTGLFRLSRSLEQEKGYRPYPFHRTVRTGLRMRSEGYCLRMGVRSSRRRLCLRRGIRLVEIGRM
jgi:hypothetical protein